MVALAVYIAAFLFLALVAYLAIAVVVALIQSMFS